MAVSYVDRQALAVIAPTVCEKLGISDAQYGVLTSAFAFAYLIGAPFAGRLIDLVGARRGLLGAVLLWSIVAALHAIAPGFGALFALRIALGLAEAPSFPGASQTVQRALPPDERARGFGVLFSGSSLGAMVAAPLATWLTGKYGFQFAFVGTAIVGLCWVPLWLMVTSSPAARAAMDLPPRVEKAPAATGSVFRDQEQDRLAKPVTGFAVLAHPAVLRATLTVMASAPLINLLFSWGAKLLAREHHVVQADMGHYLWFPPLFFDAGAITIGHLASKSRAGGNLGPPRIHMGVSVALAAIGGLLIPLAHDPMTAMLYASVALIGGGGMYALTASDMLARVPPEAVATAGGICAAAQSIAQIISNLAIGALVKDLGYLPILFALAAWNLPGGLAWLLWKPPPIFDAPKDKESETAAT
jgi:ACS family hexuronate transporter-like MFS transporter